MPKRNYLNPKTGKPSDTKKSVKRPRKKRKLPPRELAGDKRSPASITRRIRTGGRK